MKKTYDEIVGNPARVMRSELYLYWFVASQARAEKRAAEAAPRGMCPSSSFLTEVQLCDARDELEVMAQSTDWPALRQRCASAAASLTSQKRIAAR